MRDWSELKLHHAYDVELWTDGLFALSKGNLENLCKALPTFDFAVLVLTCDDMTDSRHERKASPRDNVLFEMGLFMGALGQDRTFFVYDQDKEIKLPSDLAGVSAATFKGKPNLLSAVSPACTVIENAIKTALSSSS